MFRIQTVHVFQHRELRRVKSGFTQKPPQSWAQIRLIFSLIILCSYSKFLYESVISAQKEKEKNILVYRLKSRFITLCLVSTYSYVFQKEFPESLGIVSRASFRLQYYFLYVRGLLYGWWKKTKNFRSHLKTLPILNPFSNTFRDPEKTVQGMYLVGGLTYPCIERGMDKKITNDRGENHGYHIQLE